jgi:hypothetical protein
VAAAVGRPGAAARPRSGRHQWRFLLPEPGGGPDRPALVLGGGPVDAEALLAMGAATAVVDAVPGEPVLACLVGLAGSEADAVAALPAVREGGVALVEVDRRAPGGRRLTPGRLAAKARAAGLEPAGTWLAAPDVHRPRRYVPLEGPEALRWYLGSLFVPSTARTAAVRVAGGVLARAGLMGAVRWLAPHYCMLLRRGGSGPPRPAALGAVRAAGAGEPLRTLVLTSGQDAASRVVLLPFREGEREPVAVLKAATLPAGNRDTEAELDRLLALREPLPRSIGAALPRPLGTGRLGELAVTAQTAAQGQAMDRACGLLGAGRLRRDRDLRLAVAWATAFQRATTARRLVWDGAVADDLVVGPLRRLVASYDPEGGDGLVHAAAAWSAAADGTEVPLVAQHFDLAPCNLFLAGRRVTVLDWELSEARRAVGTGLPVDVLALVTFWLFQACGASSVDEEAALVARLVGAPGRGRGPVATAGRAVHRWCRDLGLDPAMVPVLHAALWVERAHYQRARADALGLGDDGPARHAATAFAFLGALAGAGVSRPARTPRAPSPTPGTAARR